MSIETPVEELEGRALDEAVAEEVMGWELNLTINGRRGRSRDLETGGWEWRTAPQYSTDMSAAWTVTADAIHVSLATNGTGYICCVQYDESDGTEAAPTAPEAICRAALKAVRSEDES